MPTTRSQTPGAPPRQPLVERSQQWINRKNAKIVYFSYIIKNREPSAAVLGALFQPAQLTRTKRWVLKFNSPVDKMFGGGDPIIPEERIEQYFVQLGNLVHE